MGGSDTGTGDGGQYQATGHGIAGRKKIFVVRGHWGHILGLGKWPWGSKQWGIVVGCLRGLVGILLNLGSLTVGKGPGGGRGRALALPLPPGWGGESERFQSLYL